MTSHPTSPTREFVGPYQIETLLGEGGMSTVHLARHRAIGRYSALKIMRSEFCSDESMLARFLGEAQMLSRVHHRNVVAVEGFGRTPWGAPYIVMEYLKGEDLQTRLDQRGHLPWAEVLDLARQLLLALRAIHAHGIVHRDLKPQNCVIVDTDEGSCLKLVDFGISKSIVGGSATTTRPDLILGTPCYIAPEQARGERVDARTDLYAAGVMLFELLTGRPPFLGATAPELIAQHLGLVPPSVFDANPDCDAPTSMDGFVQRSMAKDPDHRFLDANQMLRALEELEHPDGRRYPLLRRIAVVAGGVVALGLAGTATPLLGLDSWTRASPVPLMVEEIAVAPTPSQPSRVLLAMEAELPATPQVLIDRPQHASKLLEERLARRARSRARARAVFADVELVDVELADDEKSLTDPEADEATPTEPSVAREADIVHDRRVVGLDDVAIPEP